MQIYENRNDSSYRSTSRCGYCRKEGHNRYNCPEVARDWAYWKDFKVPVTTSGWYMSRNNPKYWGEWYEKCKETHEEQERRRKKPKVSRKRSLPTCGFCGDQHHTRRNCPEMESFLKKAYKANENWRRAAYKEIVEKNNICVGACIEVQRKEGWGSNAQVNTEIGLITEVNFDSLNVMAAYDGHPSSYTNPYECQLSVKALVNNKTVHITIRTSARSYSDSWQKDFPVLDGDIIRSASSTYYSSHYLSKVLSPSEHPLDEKWITDYKEAFDLLVRKRSKEQLDSDGATAVIEKWRKKD